MKTYLIRGEFRYREPHICDCKLCDKTWEEWNYLDIDTTIEAENEDQAKEKFEEEYKNADCDYKWPKGLIVREYKKEDYMHSIGAPVLFEV